MAPRKHLKRTLIAPRDPGHERLVAVIHCNAMAAIRCPTILAFGLSK
jgi:hypothetical protein